LAVLLAVAAILTAASLAAAQSPAPIMTPFPVSQGVPFRVCAESPDIVWYTMPAQDALGRLRVTANGYETDAFTVPTPAGEPYDISCAGGVVWLTERVGNKIASFNPTNSTWTEYVVPTEGSEPTGIDVQAGDPAEVWFVERVGNKVGRLRVPQSGGPAFDEYVPPAAWTGMQPEDIDVYAPGLAWFTAPGLELIARLNVTGTAPTFFGQSTAPGSRPWSIAAASGTNPWFTDRLGNRIGQFTPGTATNLTWYALPNPNSRPVAIQVTAGQVWFAELAGRAGSIKRPGTSIRELSIPGASFTDVSFDASGCGWLADNAQSRLVRWCSPYFYPSLYLPLVGR
jgi:streptogramin lyase